MYNKKYSKKSWKNLDNLTTLTINSRGRKLKEFMSLSEHIAFNIMVWCNEDKFKNLNKFEKYKMRYDRKYNIICLCYHDNTQLGKKAKFNANKIRRYKCFL